MVLERVSDHLLPLGPNQRDLEVDFEIVPHQDSAGFERGVPSESEVAPFDFGSSGSPDPGIAVRVLLFWGWPLHLQDDFLRHAMHRQVAFDAQLSVAVWCDRLTLESDSWVFLDMKEIGALEMGVPGIFEGADCACIDLHFDLRCTYILRIVGDGTLNTTK